MSATPAKREPGSVEPQAHQASGIAPLDGTVSPAGSRSALAPPRQLVGRLVQIVIPVGDLDGNIDEDAPGVKSWVWDKKASSSYECMILYVTDVCARPKGFVIRG